MSNPLDRIKTHKISADGVNSTKALLTSSATFTGSWEDVTQFTTVAVAIKGDNATDGTLYIESSQDGGTVVNSVPFTVNDASFDLPHIWNVVETHIRIRYVNGTTAQTGHFQLQTKYSNGQELGLLQSAGDTINDQTNVQNVRAIGTGKDSNGNYANLPASGKDNNNSTSDNLGIDEVFTGAWTKVDQYAEIKLSYDADVNGATCFAQFSPDASTVERNIAIPPQANTEQTNFGAVHTLDPILTYFRVVYTNGGVAQTSFSLTTTLGTQNGGGLISRATQVLNKFNDVKVVRVSNTPEADRNLSLLNYQLAKRKFGKNEAVGNGAFEAIWQGTAGTYTFPSSAETLRVRSGGDANDTDTTGSGARKIEITYLDSTWTEVIETINLAGASVSAVTSNTAFRVIRVRVTEVGTYHGSNIGDIIIENSITNTELAVIKAGVGITEQCITTVPVGKTMYITSIFASVGQNNSADIRLLKVVSADVVSAPFSSLIEEWGLEDYTGAENFPLKTFLKVEEKSDVWIEAIRITGSGSARVSVDFSYILQDN
jgi:hypothetical protein